MDIQIRLARKSDSLDYTNLLLITYQVAYVDKDLGLTKECFSKEIFNTSDTQKYLLSNLLITPKQKCWLAFIDNELVGSISVIEGEGEYELRGFYVAPMHQGKGIGTKLWKKVKRWVKFKDITLDIYAHNTRTINIYQRWGFYVDKKRGEFYRHWEEWPENVKAKCIYMRLSVTP